MDNYLSLSKDNVREKAYSQKELNKQMIAHCDLLGASPYLEVDKNRLMQIYKVQLFLLVEAAKHFTKKPEYLKSVLNSTAYVFGEPYIKECMRHEVEFPEELYQVLERICFRPEQEYNSYMLSGLEVYGEDGFYDSPVFEEFANDVNLVLKIFQPYWEEYEEVQVKLDLKEIEAINEKVRPLIQEHVLSDEVRALLEKIQP